MTFGSILWVALPLAALVTVLVVAARSSHLVPTGHIGLVYRKGWARHDPRDRFEVRTHGGLGPQADTLPANRRYLRPAWLYRIEDHPLTKVPPGTIGVVYAHFGEPIPADQQLARHVECRNFTDARAFLLGGGEMGRQPHILTSGSHAINPYLFEVLTVATIGDGKYELTADDLREIVIPPGSTGVVTVHAGQPRDAGAVVAPRIAGHASFQYAHRFINIDAGGQVGTQEETLASGGVYRINPWFAQVSLIPTKDLILEWRPRAGKPASNYDAELDRISVSVDGVVFSFDVSQTVMIPPEAAPMLVARLGDVEADAYGFATNHQRTPIKRFVNGVLSHVVEGNILSIAREYTAVQFLVSHAAVQAQLATNMTYALDGWGVQVGQTTLSRFEVNDPRLVEGLLRAATAEQERKVLDILKVNVVTERQIEEVRDAIQRGHLRLRSAELEDQAKIRSTELAAQINVLGRDHVALEKFLAQLAKVRVPEWVGGGVDILNSLPLPVAKEMINNAMRAAAGSAEPAMPLDHTEAAEEIDAAYDQDSRDGVGDRVPPGPAS